MKKILLLFIIMCVSPMFGMVSSELEKFFDAVEEGDIDTMKKLMRDNNFGPDIAEEHGNTALSFAIQQNDNTMVRELLSMGADIAIANEEGQTPLGLAIKLNNSSMVDVLLQYGSTERAIDQQDADGNTPFLLALNTQNIAIINAILNEVPNPFIANNEGEDALTFVQKITDESLENQIMPLLAKAQNQFNLYEVIDDIKPNQPITHAKLAEIKKLITSDMSLITSSIERNPLIAAIGTKKLDIVKLIIEQKKGDEQKKIVNQTFKKNKITPLMIAVSVSTPEIVKYLLEKKADPNLRDTDDKILLFMVGPDNIKMIKLLIEQGIDVNNQMNIPNRPKNMTVLMIAAEYGAVNAVKEYLGAGADPFLKNAEGETALDLVRKEAARSTRLIDKANFNNIIELLEAKEKELLLLSALKNFTQKLKVLPKMLFIA